MVPKVTVAATACAIVTGCAQHGGAPVSLAARFDDVSSSLGGTWADEAGCPLLVVTCPYVCWIWEKGQWRMGKFVANGGLETGGERYSFCRVERWQCEKLRNIGFAAEEGCWYFGKDPTLSRPRRWGETLPDEKSASKISLKKVSKVSDDAIQDGASFNARDYVGVWNFGTFLARENAENMRYISIRRDGTGCVFVMDNGSAVPCGEIRWTAEMGGVRCMDYGEKPYYANESTDAYYLWLDDEKGRLVASRWDNWGEMKRVRGIEDPAEACRRMMRSRKYSGCWSGGEMFNAFTIAFDPDGAGFFTGGMSASPFKWSSDGDGNIELKLPLPYGDVTNMVARYDYATDTMSVMGQRRGRRNTKIKSSRPVREMQEALFKEVEENRARYRSELESKYDRKSGEMAFADMESMMAWLKEAERRPGEIRTVLLNTPVPQLSDNVAYSAKDGWTASLGVGYFERGERPPEADVSALRWSGGMRPPALPPAQVECRDGMGEMLERCKVSGIVDISNGARQKMTQWWYCCCDTLNVRGVGRGKEAEFAEALSPRLAARFPCKTTATTISPK